MSVVWFWLIQDARARWRTWVLWTALVGFGGGIALTAFAGARRTDAAVPQMLTYSRPDDGSVAFGQFCPPQHVTGPNATSLAPLPVEARVLRLPQVASFQREMFLFASVRPIFDASSNLNVIATADAQGYRTLDRPLIVAGRVPDPTSGSDVWVNVLAANMLHVHVGSEVRLYTYSAAQLQGCGNLVGAQSHGPVPNGPVLTVRIAGIGRLPADVNAVLPLAQAAGVNYEGQSNMFLGPGFVGRYAASLGIPVHDVLGTNIYYVRLRHAQADWSAFAAAASKLDPNAFVQSEADGGSSGQQAAAASAQRGVHVEVVALILFGAFAALVTLVLAGQLMARQILIERDEYALLRSLGARHAQIRVVVLSRAALVGAAASIVAVAVAIVASPLMPFGLARQAELHPGVDVDAPVLAAGLAVIGILVVALAVVPAIVVSRGPLDQARAGEAPSRQPRLGRLLALTALPITTVMGVRFGLRRGRGRTAVPVGSALVGAIAAVATLVGALTFAASLDHLIRTPRQQGWNWDVLVGNPNTTSDPWSATVPKLAHNQLVGSYSGMVDLNGGFTLDGHVVANVLAIKPVEGSVTPPLLEGRAPHGPNEIVLGAHTLDTLRRHIGDTVTLATPAGRFPMFITGTMIMPSVGDLLQNSVGDGAWVTDAFFEEFKTRAAQQPNLPPLFYALFPVRYAPGASPAAAYASLQHDFGPVVLEHLAAQDVINLQDVESLPLVLAALVALLGVAALANTLITSVRRRRRDLACLKTLGFQRRQIAATIAWQATSFAVAALVIGVPIGLVAGRTTWRLIAAQLNSTSPAVVPLAAIAIIIPATIIIANVVAAVPAHNAARTRPAQTLRNE